MPEFSKFSERSLSRSDVGFSDLEVERHLLIALQKGSGRTDLRSFVLEAALPVASIERVLERMLQIYPIEIQADERGNWLLRYDPDALKQTPETGRTALEQSLRRRRQLAWFATIPLALLWANFFLPLYWAYYFTRALWRSFRLPRYLQDMEEAGIAKTPLNVWAELMRDDDAPGLEASVLKPATRTDRRFELEKFRIWLLGERQNLKGEFEAEQDLLVWLADREGITSRAELTAFTAWVGPELEREITRLMTRFDGHIHVTEDAVELIVLEDLRHVALPATEELFPAWDTPERERLNAWVSPRVGFVMATINFVIPLLTILALDFFEAEALDGLFVISCFSLLLAGLLYFLPRISWEKRLRAYNGRRINRNLRRAFLEPIVQSGAQNLWVREDELYDHASAYESPDAVWPFNYSGISYPRYDNELETGRYHWPYTVTDSDGNEKDIPAPMGDELARTLDYLVEALRPEIHYEHRRDEISGEEETVRWLRFPQFAREPAAAISWRQETHTWEDLELHAKFLDFEREVAEHERNQAPQLPPHLRQHPPGPPHDAQKNHENRVDAEVVGA